MTRVALRGLLGRKLRAVLTAFAIILGVAMISGTYVLTDTIDKAFGQIFNDSYKQTSAVVTGRESGINYQGNKAEVPPVPESLLAKVRSVSDVLVASGFIRDQTATKILDRNGKAVDTKGAPSFGFGIDTAPAFERFNPLHLQKGNWARGPNQVVIDAATAKDQHYGIGDRVGIATLQPVRKFRLVGIAKYGTVDTIGSATFAVFDVPTAQGLLDRKGEFDAISVAAKPGVTPEKLVRELRSVLPASAVQVRTGEAEAKKKTNDISSFTNFLRYLLLAFAAVALFVGAFVIFNTLSITVAQRTRELATLRTLGASRGQVLRSVALEALVIGVLASLVGLFVGVGLAKGVNSLFKATGLDLPQVGLVFATRTIILSLTVGIVITLVAGLFPAIRATRVAPIAAVREGATLPPGRLAPYTAYIAGVTVAVAIALLSYSLFVNDIPVVQRLLAMGVGVLALFAGVAMLSSRLVRPIAAVVGWPARRLGGAAGRLAQGNTVRNTGRTAATAAALMIGLALVTFVAVFANGMKQSNRGAIEDQVKADYLLTSQNGFDPFVTAAGAAIRKAPQVSVASDVRSSLARVSGASRYITGIEPRTITRVYHFDWKDGSDAVATGLPRDGAIVDKDFAKDKHLKVGSRFTLMTPNRKHLALRVSGIYKPPPFYPILGSVSITVPAFDSVFERPRNAFTFVDVDAESDAKTKAALDATVRNFPDAKVQSRSEWIKAQDKDFNDFLTMLYVLLALSVIVSLFGMVNTLVLSVFERTRELGMLRAVGMTRRQVRRMIRQESVITALIGAALGLPLGVLLAALVTKALSQFDVRFAIPVTSLVIFTIVAIIAGVLAAILPARRASRLRILRALQYE